MPLLVAAQMEVQLGEGLARDALSVEEFPVGREHDHVIGGDQPLRHGGRRGEDAAVIEPHGHIAVVVRDPAPLPQEKRGNSQRQ